MAKPRKAKAPSKPGRSSPARRLLPVLFVALAAIAAHAPSLGVPFYMDDQAHILSSQRISLPINETPAGVVARSWNPVYEYHPQKKDFSSPIYRAGQRFTAYLLWNSLYETAGFRAPAFHALNLAAHCFTAIALYFTAIALLGFAGGPNPRSAFAPTSTALLAALIFAVHPLCSEVPHYASQLTIALVTLFSVLAALGTLQWIRQPRLIWAVVTLLAIILATFSKEPGVFHALLNVGLIMAILAPGEPWTARLRQRPLVLLAVAVAGGAAVVFYAQRSGLIARALFNFTRPEYLGHVLTQARVFWEYFQRVIVPTRLSSDHLIASTISAQDAISIVAALGIVLVIAGILVALAKRQRLLALLATLAIAPLLLRFLDIGTQVMVEYRVYPAMPWISLLASVLLGMALRRHSKPAVAVATTIVAILAVMSFQRGLVWQSAESIVADITRQYPLHIRSLTYLQHRKLQDGQTADVLTLQARAEDSFNAVVAFNRESDLHHRRYDLGRAISGFMLGEQLSIYALIDQGQPQVAKDRANEVIELMRPFFTDDRSRAFAVLYRARGKAKAALGENEAAREDYEACLERKPGDPETMRLLEALE